MRQLVLELPNTWGGADVHPELLRAAERDHERQGHEPPGAVVEAGPGPDLAPRVAREQVRKAAHIVPPTGAEGLNLAVAENDVARPMD